MTTTMPRWRAILAAASSVTCAVSAWTQWTSGLITGIVSGIIVTIIYINAHRRAHKLAKQNTSQHTP